jgi:hypothetical protein
MENCLESSEVAFRVDRGDFTEMKHFTLDDTEGYWGRAPGRNVMLGMARGWGADWLLFVDATDVVHPRALRRLSETIRKHPNVQTVVGCLSLWWNVVDTLKDENLGDEVGKAQHLYRSKYDIAPLRWEKLIEKKNVGTIGTHTAIRMDLAWKLGFRPDLPAAEFFEFQHVALASGQFEKIKHPLNVINRSANHANKADDPNVNHGPLLNEAILAVNQAWKDRGRVPLTYEELEERWGIRQYRTDDLIREMHITDIAMDDTAIMREF